ncbi:hypothetical protein VaNZ11_005836 [Volvox africanus]|uniref:Uncharacterized protein n=1 Tax=Volvox africanus TaxID=51714 RepID=A0ABQ5RZZ1_9CHLO|nr:hypothetical protein VaNZ11_005836 [Volvox africanus]
MERSREGSRRGITTDTASAEASTPFATAFASSTVAAGGGAAANITVPEASVVTADRMMTNARPGPSASMPAPGTSGLPGSTTSLPVCRPFASPLTSASASYRIRTPAANTAGGGAGATGSADSGGTLFNARPRSSATDFFTPVLTPSSGVSGRCIQRLLQKLDSVCSGTSVVGTNVLYDYPGDYDIDAERLYRENSLSMSSQRLDEQEFQQLLMMLPASPEMAARVDLMPPPPPAEPAALATNYGDAVAAVVHGNSDDGLTSAVPPSPPQVRLPTAGVAGGAAERGASIDRDVAAIVPEAGDGDCLTVRGEVLAGELGFMGTGAPSSGQSEIAVAKTATVAEPPEQLIDPTPRPLLGNLTAVSEVARSAAVALVGKQREPRGGARTAKGGGGGGGGGETEGFHAWDTDGGAATGWPSTVVDGGGSNGKPHVDIEPKVLHLSSGNCSSSFSDSAERELSLRQLVARGSVDRGRGSVWPVGSASTSASLTLASHILDDAPATTLTSAAVLASTPPPPSPPPPAQVASTAAAAAAASLSTGSESLGPPLRSRSHKAWGSGDGSSCGDGGRGDGVAKVGATLVGGTGGSDSDSDRDRDSDGLGGFLSLAVSRPVTAIAANRRRRMVSEQAACTNHGTIDGPYPTRQRWHQQQLQQYLQQADGSGEQQQHGVQQQQQQQQNTRTMLRGRSHHWAPLHPKPPSRPRRASAQNYSVAAWAATAAQPPRSPPLQSPPLPSPPPPRSAVVGGDGAMPSSSSAQATTGLDEDGGSSLVAEPRRGAVPTSPLQARLFVGPGRSNRSLSEPSSSLRDPTGSAFKSIRPASPPSSLYGSGGGADDEDNNSPSSDWDFEVRQIGLTAPAAYKLAVAAMPSPPSAPASTAAVAASRPSAAAALEAAANLVALIDEDLNRNTTAVSVSSGTRKYQDSLRPLSPLPPDTTSLTPTSPQPMYPHPPPAFPLPWPPSATAAAPATVEATAGQRAMCGRSQRRLGTSQPSLKHSSFGSRLETLEEEVYPRSALSAAGAAAAAGGDSSSSSGDGRPWSTASGTSNADGIGGRRQPLRNTTRRSTSSTPRHLHRRRRLTGEPGENSSDDSSSGSSGDEYLQALFRPLRHAPPHDFAINPPATHLTGLTLVGQAPLCTAQPHPGANSTLPSTASSELRSSRSFGFHSQQTGHDVQPPPAALAPSSPPLPPPSPPPLPQQQHSDRTWARRPSFRICNTDSTGASGGAGAALGINATVTTLAVYGPPGGRGAAASSATLAPQPPSLQVPAGVAAAPAADESAAVTVYDRVGDGINGQLACTNNASASSWDVSQVQPLNIDRLKRDLERLLAK